MNVGLLSPELQAMRVDIISCRGCGAFRECTKPVPFYGTHLSPIMFVARNPGEQEDMHNLPLYPHKDGLNAGKIFDRILYHLQLNREEIYVTNVMKCFTTIPKKNRPPTNIECKICCGLYLFKEIEMVNPELIITMGTEAFGCVATEGFNFSNIKITKIAGKLVVGLRNIPVFPLLHPAAMLHNDGYKIQYKKHIFTLKSLWQKYRDSIYRREFKANISSILATMDVR
jgi:DNA polymerase